MDVDEPSSTNLSPSPVYLPGQYTPSSSSSAPSTLDAYSLAMAAAQQQRQAMPPFTSSSSSSSTTVYNPQQQLQLNVPSQPTFYHENFSPIPESPVTSTTVREDELEVEGQLGYGMFSQVFLARHRATGSPYE